MARKLHIHFIFTHRNLFLFTRSPFRLLSFFCNSRAFIPIYIFNDIFLVVGVFFLLKQFAFNTIFSFVFEYVRLSAFELLACEIKSKINENCCEKRLNLRSYVSHILYNKYSFRLTHSNLDYKYFYEIFGFLF